MTFAKTIRLEANNPSQSGRLASDRIRFGEFGRFALAAVHTRFEAVTWMVFDAEQEDELTGKPKIIRQADSAAEAIRGLPGAEEVSL
jgi:hypothetical protein